MVSGKKMSEKYARSFCGDSEKSTGNFIQTSVDNLGKSTGSLRKPKDNPEKSTESLMKSKDILEKSTGNLIKSKDILEESTSNLIKSKDNLEESTENLIISKDILGKSTGNLMKSKDILDESTGSLIKSEDILEESTGDNSDKPEDNSAISKTNSNKKSKNKSEQSKNYVVGRFSVTPCKKVHFKRTALLKYYLLEQEEKDTKREAFKNILDRLESRRGRLKTIGQLDAVIKNTTQNSRVLTDDVISDDAVTKIPDIRSNILRTLMTSFMKIVKKCDKIQHTIN